MCAASLSVRPVTQEDRQQLTNLIHFEVHVHRHLDWRSPLEWIGYSPFLVAEENKELVAALACPPDPPGVAWIRLFAVLSGISLISAWEALWPAAIHASGGLRSLVAAAIPFHPWFFDLLEASHFTHTDNVVVLVWERAGLPPPHSASSITIRPMEASDLPEVQRIDAAAFGLIWQNSLDSLNIAFHQSSLATVAVGHQGLLGYQISTASALGAHLARLAVLPTCQRQGIGYALVYDLLRQFNRRGVLQVTVNTQEENLASLALYQKAGFRQTQESYKVYQLKN